MMTSSSPRQHSPTPLRIGIIGAGYAGRTVHIPAWAGVPESAVVALCDPDPAALAAASALAPGAALCADYRALLQRAPHDLDAVSICTPNVSHFPVALAALHAGVHVYCEKPLCTSPADLRALGAAADERGLVLAVRHQLRFESGIEAARARVAMLGPLHTIRVCARRRDRIPTTPGLTDAALSGGGAALDLGVHVLDLALWMSGLTGPAAVAGARVMGRARDDYGRGRVPGYRNAWGAWDATRFSVEDTASARITLVGGLTIALECAWACEAEVDSDEVGTWCEFTGPAGTYRWTASTSSTRETANPNPDFTAFVGACRSETPFPLAWREALASIELLDAFYRSVREGREVEVVSK